MDTTQIHAALWESRALPRGRMQVERLEILAAAAKSASDRALEGEVLLQLAQAYTYAGERDLAPVTYGRLLRIYDEFPSELGPFTHSIHWYLKWMTWGLIDNPAVALPTVYRWLDELENRYRQRGYSPRPVLTLRAELARKLDDQATSSALLAAAMAAPRDSMSDCDACERNEWGSSSAYFGEDEAALAHWRPVIDGERSCAEEPHRVLAQALLPLVRTGRLAEARSAHLTGYSLVRHMPDLRHSVGMHIEFCALTGNEARGLEILAEHASWLTEPGADASSRLSFVTGVCVLLRRLVTLELGTVGVGTGTVDSTLAELDSEIAELSARYDARNGNTAVSSRVARRLTQRPLLDRLPLGMRGKLPRSARIPVAAAHVAVEDAADFAAEARRLAELATARLSDDPGVAEAQLREALQFGAGVLPAEHVARLSSQLVTAVAGQPGRDLELADAALNAAARWEGISEPDVVHHTVVAARALHRAGRHGEAAVLFEQALADNVIPYPRAELALVRGQFGDSLQRLGRNQDAAKQFAEAARLVQHDADRRELHAELAWSAAGALEGCGQEEQALAAYLRAAELWDLLGMIRPRAKCLRSAAWLQLWNGGPALDTMRELLAELRALALTAPSLDISNEIANTRDQMVQMLAEDVGDAE
ncbi:hypothetical protein [Nocardia sp. NPDC052566]|uniref:hypothetical protein n=1 Tax=Nocardia sp. NPDC052566 TaxID=3364330 RepID=UPI0037C67EE4